MATFKTPGVYIDEVSTLPPSVAPVPTSIPGFVGYTKEATLPDGTDVAGQPVRITSLLEFETIFGGPYQETFEVTLTGTVPSPTEFTIVQKSTSTDTLSSYILYYQLQMFYANGGGTCYVTSAGLYTATATAPVQSDLATAITTMEQIDEVTILVTPESAVLSIGDQKVLNDLMLTQCEKMEDRFAVMDVVHFGVNTIQQDADAFRNNGVGADNLKYGASYYPGLDTTLNYAYENTGVAIVDNRGGAGAGPYNGETLEVIKSGATGPTIDPDTELYNRIAAELAKLKLQLYPSASMAGIYARVDSQRGVWKAPANVGLALVEKPSILIDGQSQENLNVDSTSGKSINAIRQFTGRGNLVWGARTLAGNDNEWRYVNVRRLFLFVEESIKKSSEFVVFEPNTATTWQRVRGTAEAFLTSLWRDGGLAGATTEEAFFVNVGLGSTMTSQDILEGRMIVEIGIAAVRPAEFIILRFSHKLQES